MKEKEKYYSNCLIESIKAKIKNWNNVKIIFIPKYLSINNRGFHFYWKELDSGLYYDFIYAEYDNKWFCKFWFKGRIRCQDEEHYARYLNLSLSKYTYKLGKRMGFTPQQNLYNTEKWRLANEPINPNGRKSDKIMYAIKDDFGEIIFKIVDVKDLTLIRFHTDEELEKLKKGYEEINQPFDIEYEKQLMAIKEFENKK